MRSATKARLRQTRSPISGLGREGKRALVVLGLVAAMNAAGLVLIAESLARAITAVFEQLPLDSACIWLGALGVALRAAATWANRTHSARAVSTSKIQIRHRLVQRVLRGSDQPTGALGTLGTRGLDDLDEYFTTFLPALVSAAIIPLVLFTRILFADWLSAIVIALTIPLVPLFMILIGLTTRDAVDRAQDALLRLSGHLVELARGLPVLVGLGRVRDQAGALDRLSDEYRQRTMRTLRTVFMSSLALELISTISMAVIAVFIGVRLVYGGLDLEIGLLVLILAPDCYAPFRQAGAAYHSAEDGVVALERVKDVSRSPAHSPLWAQAEQHSDHKAPREILVRDLGVAFDGREPLFDAFALTAPAGAMTLLDGPSGAGKSTILAVLAGRIGRVESTAAGSAAEDALGVGSPAARGTVSGIDPQRIAWVPQHPHTFGESVLAELLLHAQVEDATGGVSAPGDASTPTTRVLRVLDEIGLLDSVPEPERTPPHALSPGELRRLAIARALLRIDAGATTALFDEPTAHLDARSAELVRRAIARRRGKATMIIASHDPLVHAMCNHRVRVTATATDASVTLQNRSQQERDSDDEAVPLLEAMDPSRDERTFAESRGDFGIERAERAAKPSPRIPILLRLLKPAGWALVLGIIVAVLAVVFGITQTSLSGWLIVRAAEQPPILLLMVTIVGVRFFGIGRSVLRYLERLQVHDAVFRLAGRLRRQLWDTLASTALRFKRLRTGPAALDLLVRDVDAIRDEVPRVVVPQIVAAATLSAMMLAAAVWLPAAIAPLLMLALVALVLAPAVVRISERRATSEEERLRSRLSQRFTALVEASHELHVHRAAATPLSELGELEAEAMRVNRRGAWAQGAAHALVVGTTIAAVVWLAADAWFQNAAGGGSLIDAKLLAAFALGMLALAEPLTDGVTAVQRWPRLRLLLDSVRDVLGDDTTQARHDDDVSASAVTASERIDDLRGRSETHRHALELRNVTVGWPEQNAAVFDGLSFALDRGEWLTVTGPSGSGKSTLLATAMGHLPPNAGEVLVAGETIHSDTAGRIAWCPQEGHLFNSTLRGNLVLSRSTDDRPTDDELVEVLRQVGLGDFLHSLEDGLDTKIGADGSWLSGGQRQRVAIARTLLTRAPVVLLDEPTAHLDEEAAVSLMADLRVALADRAVVCVTHRRDDLSEQDLRLQLPESSLSRTSELTVAG